MKHDRKNRFRIFVERCAPLQVSYLGYPGTTGSNCIDYLIADKILIPKLSIGFILDSPFISTASGFLDLQTLLGNHPNNEILRYLLLLLL